MQSLTLDNYHEVVRLVLLAITRVSLRPGYATPMQFTVESFSLVVKWTAQDSQKPAPNIGIITGSFKIPYLRDEVEAVLWLRACMQSVLLHELDEFIRLDGAPAINPHENPRIAQPDDPIPDLLSMARKDHGLQLQVRRHIAMNEGYGHMPYRPTNLFELALERGTGNVMYLHELAKGTTDGR